MDEWEYKVVPASLLVQTERIKALREGRKPEIDSIQDVLNEAGKEGWELVTAYETLQAAGESGSVYAFLKRMKSR